MSTGSWVRAYRPGENESHSTRRYRRILWTGLANGLAQVVSMAAGLFSLRLTVRYLGPERYGLWVAVSAWLQVLAFTDFGVGNGLINLLSEANGKDDKELARQYLSSAAALLSGLSLFLFGAFALTWHYLNWATVFNVKSALAASEVAPTVMILAFSFFLDFPLGLAGRVYAAYQEGYVSCIWAVGGSLAGLVAIVLSTSLHLGLPSLALSIVAARSLVKLANTVDLFRRSKRWLRPTVSLVRWHTMRKLLRLGGLYSVANIGFLLEMQAPYIVGPHVVGLSALGRFGVAQRLYSTALILPTMFISPLWPAFGEAITRRDFAWVRRTLVRCYKVTLVLCVPLIIGITLMGPWLISVWVGPRLVPERSLLALLGMWFVARVWRETHTMVLNGSGRILGQATYGTVSAICGLFFAEMLGRHFQLDGLISGWLLGFLILNAWLFPAEVWHFLSRNATEASIPHPTERSEGI